MSRIVGQCNTADFRSIEHLALALESPEMFDPSTVSRKQKLALVFVAALQEAGVEFKETYKIKEILFWDDGHAELRFFNVPGAKELRVKLGEPKVRADMARGVENILGIKAEVERGSKIWSEVKKEKGL